jgi:hypothetical protein
MPDAMTDADFEKEMARVKIAVDRWYEPLGLRLWQRVDVRYWREPLTDDNGQPLTVVADCHADWKYLCAQFRFCLPKTADWDDDQLDYIVRHEMLHALVNEMRADGGQDNIDHEERVVTNLAMVLGWVREQGQADAPKDGRRKR